MSVTKRTGASLAELQELERRYAIPTYARQPVEFVRGEGVRLWDQDGHEYLDFLAGISVLNVGHCHPRVVEVVREQVGTLTHATSTLAGALVPVPGRAWEYARRQNHDYPFAAAQKQGQKL